MLAAKTGNFIDFFFIILGLRILYIAGSQKVLAEAFRIIGLFIGSLLAFQYYPALGDNLNTKIGFLTKEQTYFIPFFSIILSIVIVFGVSRRILTLLFKRKEGTAQTKLALLIAGLGRAVFLFSVIIFGLHLSPLDSKYFNQSLAYKIFKDLAPRVYLASFKFFHKLNSQLILNEEVKKYREYSSVLENKEILPRQK